MKKSLELLAPAGTWEALEAAVNAGADAVYLGGKAFGARAYAGNFDRDELSRAVRFAHLHGVRLFVAVNTLADDREMRELADYLAFLSNAGVDAIIVQDLGVLRLARLVAPELPRHASTQMTITNAAGVRFAADCGMVRAVPARELSIADLRAAAAEDIEIEAFIHGALCVCYSGQCLMSSLIGGRSGNRGRCAQPCRMPYTLIGDSGENLLRGSAGAYLLSPCDLNTFDVLPQMIEAGVCSFKIEGRMKRPEYVAVVVDAYRRAIDSYLAGDYRVPERDRANVEQIFNRGFTTAYLTGRPGRKMISDTRPDNRGVLVGRVESLHRGRAAIRLEKGLRCGDGLEFAGTGESGAGTTVASLTVGGCTVERAPAGSLAEIDVPPGVRRDAPVFRTLDKKLIEYAATFYGEKNKRRVPVNARVSVAVGRPLEVEFSDGEGHTGTGRTSFLAEAARTRPLDKASLRRQLERLGATEYVLDKLELALEGELMVPVGEINEARRQACEALDRARLDDFLPPRRPVENAAALAQLERENAALKKLAAARPAEKTRLSVWTDRLDGVRAALDGGADWVIFGGDRYCGRDAGFSDCAAAVELIHAAGRRAALGTPRIVAEPQLRLFEKFLRHVQDSGADQLNVHNLGLWQLAREMELKIPLWADMSLNIYNSQSLLFWRESGAAGATPSVELNMPQIRHLAGVSPLPLECLVQGPVEMMVSEYNVGDSFLGGKGKDAAGRRGEIYLRDRTRAAFRLASDQFGRMHVLNSQDLCALDLVPRLREIGVARLRIDARTYRPDGIRRLTDLYRRALSGTLRNPLNLPNTTRGHYSRGVM